MATANDRSPLSPAGATPGRASWLGVVGLGLAIVLFAVGAVQWRQNALLDQTMRVGDDYTVLQIYQAQAEYLRLREQWGRALDDRQPLDAEALRLRYEIWVSRVGLLRNERTARMLRGHPELAQTLDRIDGFLSRADPLFTASGPAAPSRDALLVLQPELLSLDSPLHGMMLDAAHLVSTQMASRHEAVHLHNRIGIGLTLFLSALTLAFALTALRQVRKLERRRLVLEELANRLRQARRDAEAANQSKSVFLANISHEIRTPFHGLMGMLSLLRETGLSPRQISLLRTATESADHLLALLNDILDMSQLESGRMALSPAPVELRALLRDVESLMRPQAQAKSIALHVDAHPDLPEHLMADATRLRQVLFNLLSNAIKFCDHGSVLLDVQRHAGADGRDELEFLVTDTGIGMNAATVAGLFERFSQGQAAASNGHGGSGLGLEISRTLARLMGGDITATSQPGRGSAFSFRLPLPATVPMPVPSQAPLPDRQPTARRLRVLVAEDHPVNRQYMAALLENLGHETYFTVNGQEALQAAREQRFDVVLMDLHMPVMDGLTATRAIRALPDRQVAALPIVALTADAFTETRDRCMVAGMNDFLTKPVSPEKLATSLRRLFGQAGAEAGPAPPPAAAPALHAGTPLIDTAAIDAALRAMTRQRLAALIHQYLDQAPQTVQQLRAAVRDAQPLELRVHAHAARGAALNLGLTGLALTAEVLQEGAAHLPAHEIARLVQRFDELLPQTRQAVQAAGLRREGAEAVEP